MRDQMEKSLASVKIEQKINLYYGVYTIEDRGMSVDLMCDRANLALRTVKGNSNRAYAVYNDELHQVVLSEQQLPTPWRRHFSRDSLRFITSRLWT